MGGEGEVVRGGLPGGEDVVKRHLGEGLSPEATAVQLGEELDLPLKAEVEYVQK